MSGVLRIVSLQRNWCVCGGVVKHGLIALALGAAGSRYYRCRYDPDFVSVIFMYEPVYLIYAAIFTSVTAYGV